MSHTENLECFRMVAWIHPDVWVMHDSQSEAYNICLVK